MTRRMTTLKWVFYALWTLVFLLVQQLVFPYLRIAGVHPFILPSLAAIAPPLAGRGAGAGVGGGGGGGWGPRV